MARIIRPHIVWQIQSVLSDAGNLREMASSVSDDIHNGKPGIYSRLSASPNVESVPFLAGITAVDDHLCILHQAFNHFELLFVGRGY